MPKEYTFPPIPKRGTKEFREYAARVMTHDGDIIATLLGDCANCRVRGSDDMGWDWQSCTYYIEAECLPKPKERRWYTREEFLALFVTWPGRFLVRFQDRGDFIYSAWLSAFEGCYSVGVTRGVDVQEKNFWEATYSHDGGKTWHTFGVEK